MIIKTDDIGGIRPFLDKLYIPPSDSHKGQNGKVLVVGGSSLFYAASIWAAEVASYFVDMVHYSSTEENNKVFFSLKKRFRNGMVIHKKDMLHYIEEDDAVLIGPGMVRGKRISNIKYQISNFSRVLTIDDEATYTYVLTKFLVDNFPKKRFVFDAGALQMMEPEWLLKFKEKPILTPHQLEFEKLFKESIRDKTTEEKAKTVEMVAKKYRCVILLKARDDIVSDGIKTYIVTGGNAGLTKGGTGDILAGLSVALYAKNDPKVSAVLASFLLKKTADELFLTRGYWYNSSTIIERVLETLNRLYQKKRR
ncbi:NAD(P)H-hydrate dehydratase [Candidatus Roizmanbacteria bacterium]|nr:NAD(P)H-hydrate dehydratase [Candidatus Roizmanbacteria bacterium]